MLSRLVITFLPRSKRKTIALTKWTFVGQVMSLCFNVPSSFGERLILFFLQTETWRRSLVCVADFPFVFLRRKEEQILH